MDKYMLGLPTSLNTAPVKEAIYQVDPNRDPSREEAKLGWKRAVNKRKWAAIIVQRALFCSG